MASDRAKELAAKQKAARRAEKQRKRNSDDPKDWGWFRQMREAFVRTNEIDPSTKWWMIGAAAGVAAVIVVLGLVFNLAWWAWAPLALMSAILAATLVLSRKVKGAMVKRYEGQPGSAEVALQLLNKKKYNYQVGINATRQLDLVHRVVGPSGIVLIAEGTPGRVKPLLSGEAKKHEQIAYGTPVTQLVLGNGGGQVKLGDLQKHIEKLPKALQPHQVAEVNQRLKALDAVRPKAPLPKGPMPTPKGMNRAMRGR